MYERYDPDDELAIEEEGGCYADRSYWDIKEGIMSWMSMLPKKDELAKTCTGDWDEESAQAIRPRE